MMIRPHPSLGATGGGPLALVFGCLLSAGLVGSGGCGSLASQGLNADGVRLFQEGQYNQAIAEFRDAIQADPGNADGYYNLAATYHRIGKLEKRQPELDQAEQLYNQCLDRNSEHRDGYRGLAVLLVEEHRPNEAFRLLENWGAQNPISSAAKLELARMLQEFGDRKGAEAQLVCAVRIEPGNAQAWAALGQIREELGDRSQALTDYQRSLAYDRFQPEIEARAATLQVALGMPATVAPIDDIRMASAPMLPCR